MSMNQTSGIVCRMTAHEVRALRHRLGLTQRALAAALNVTETTIARWECGRRAVGSLATLALTHLAQTRGTGPKTRRGKSRSGKCPACGQGVGFPWIRDHYLRFFI